MIDIVCRRGIRSSVVAIWFFSCLAHPAQSDPRLSMSESARRGEELYDRFGCYQCHGHFGQGGINGPPLVSNVLPYEAFRTFVREPRRQMPPYRDAVLDDGQLKAIHAYVQASGKKPVRDGIPLLRDPGKTR
ncbi:MAG: hypothetical protein CALGDGBN_00145 [Pseudomonadales bacterium]|nr:hypothetical protein [Pseudomonadales bacterium]